jgi:hypothetical protein
VGFRFRRSVKLIPGVRLNLSGSGASISLGGRGFHYTIGSKGTRVTAGIPGTGIAWTQYTPHTRVSHFKPAGANPISPILGGHPPIPSTGDTKLVPIVSAPPTQINALSTSELAPILNDAHRRFRVVPLVIIACLCGLAAALNSGDQTLFALAVVHTAISVPAAILLDRYRRSLKIEYKLEGHTERIASALSEAVGDLARCSAVWCITSQGDTWDWKRHAGATKLVNRQKIYIRSKRPGCIRGGGKFPAIKLGAEELFFLPDAVLVVRTESVAALCYEDLCISNQPTGFVEEGALPSDAKVVSETWRFVAKNGGPDRRFNFNKRLPVCLYGEMDFHSAGGLNGKIQFSNSTAGDRFSKLVRELAAAGLSNSGRKPVTSFHKGKSLYSLLFCLFLILTGGPLVLASLSHQAPQVRSNHPIVAGTVPIQEEKAREISRRSMNELPRNRDANNRQGERSTPNESFRPAMSSSSVPAGESTIKPENSPMDFLINFAKPNEARRVQQRLIELGYLDGAADGKWGPRSRRALRDFRIAMAIGDGDTWDEGTQQQLFSASAKRLADVPQVFPGNATVAEQQPGSCWIPTNEDLGVGYWGLCSDKRSRPVR